MKLQMLTIVLLTAAAAGNTLARFVSHKDCNNVPQGTFVANPGNCSQYIKCNGLRSTLGECPDGTYFNAAVLSCDKSSHNCKTKDKLGAVGAEGDLVSTTTTAATTTTTTTTATPSTIPTAAVATPAPTVLPPIDEVLNGSRPLCAAWMDQQFPHPSCEHYYYCVSGFLSVRRCHFGFGWDMVRHHCVPLREANCFKPKLRYTRS